MGEGDNQMKLAILNWLSRKWQAPDPHLLESYRATFTTLHGQLVLQHLLDSVYCQVYEGTDPVAMALHAGRRSVIHELLENLDTAENPDKYVVRTEADNGLHARTTP